MKARILKVVALSLVLAMALVPVSVAGPADSHEVGFGSWLSTTLDQLTEIVGAWIGDTLIVVFEEDETGSDQQGEDEDDDGNTAVNPPTQNIGGVHVPNG